MLGDAAQQRGCHGHGHGCARLYLHVGNGKEVPFVHQEIVKKVTANHSRRLQKAVNIRFPGLVGFQFGIRRRLYVEQIQFRADTISFFSRRLQIVSVSTQ